ncbi:MAG: hypothetical protein LUE92_14665, partial [Clostridiales bacterium]|nr:hypothetical protein [Clostridiales bacterium]
MMNLILFLLFLLSIIYCCDEPVFFKGCEMLVNNHDSMLYGIGLSVIAAYIFYIFQVVIPQFLRFKQTQVIGSVKLEDICALI